METLRTLAESLLKRAANTFWQAASATAVTLFLASGLTPADLFTQAGLQRLYSAVLVGAIAAGLSAVKTVAVGYWLAHRSDVALKVYAATSKALTPVPAAPGAPVTPTLSSKAMEAALRAILDVLASEAKAADSPAVQSAQQALVKPEPWQVTR